MHNTFNKITCTSYIVSLFEVFVRAPTIHLYEIVSKMVSHKCAKLSDQSLNGYRNIISFLPKVFKNSFVQVWWLGFHGLNVRLFNKLL